MAPNHTTSANREEEDINVSRPVHDVLRLSLITETAEATRYSDGGLGKLPGSGRLSLPAEEEGKN
jgi:hypothetical protein